jgi:hypothetical protein
MTGTILNTCPVFPVGLLVVEVSTYTSPSASWPNPNKKRLSLPFVYIASPIVLICKKFSNRNSLLIISPVTNG